MKNKAIPLRHALKSGSLIQIMEAAEKNPGIIDIEIVSELPPLAERKKGVVYIECIDTSVPLAYREQDVLLD